MLQECDSGLEKDSVKRFVFFLEIGKRRFERAIRRRKHDEKETLSR
jgi:hypothetical protein